MNGRRVALSSLAAGPVEAVPGRSAAILERLDPARIAPTPLNKRTNFGTPEELAELGESIRRRQLQPVVVVSCERYLALYPEHEEQIREHEEQNGPADYVLVNGERRWRAARQVELPRLEAMIREEIADSRAGLLEAVIAENIDRLNLDPIEEAHSVEELVTECGSAAAAAKQLRRTEGWVSQRRALLKLTPEIQARVQAGEVPVRIARSIASTPPDGQEAKLADALERRPADPATRRRPRRPEEGPADRPGPAESGRDEPGVDASAASSDRTAAAEASGPQRGSGISDEAGLAGRPGTPGDFTAVTDVPWDSLPDLADLIRSRLTSDSIAELIGLLGTGAQTKLLTE
jgi:ParB family chromosome partitioning protein